jgi:hypothetical protein
MAPRLRPAQPGADYGEARFRQADSFDLDAK